MELNHRQVKIIPVDETWLNLIRLVRSNVQFGTLTIVFKDGKPFEAIEVKKTIRF